MKDKLNILVISDKYPPLIDGGYELSCYRNVEQLRKKGNTVNVLTIDYGCNETVDNKSFKEVFRILKSTKLKMDYKNAYIKSILMFSYLARRNFYITKQSIMKLQPQLVYAFQLYDATFTPLLAANYMKIPVVADIGDDWWVSIARMFIYGSAINRLKKKLRYGFFEMNKVKINHFIANSERTGKKLVEIGVGRDKITVLPRFVTKIIKFKSQKSMSPRTVPSRSNISKEIRIVYGGRLCQEKGIHDLINIISNFSKKLDIPPLTVDVFGRGSNEYEYFLKQKVKQNSLEGIIRFHGLIPEDKFLDKLCNYHIFLFPFLWDEPFGRSVIQAMANGVVVIASGKGGVSEIIEHGKNGFLSKPGEIEGFTNILLELVNNNELFDKIVKEGLETVSRRYSISTVFPKIEKVLIENSK